MAELNKIYQGDCLELIKEIESQSINMVLTDPPYFLPAKHYGARKFFKRNFSDIGILEGYFRQFFIEIERIIKPNGIIYMFCDGQSYPLFYWYIYHFSKSIRPLIWDKKVSINGYHWRHQHELIIFAEMPESKPIPTGDGDILRYSAVKVNERIHPAEKPIELVEALIKKSSKENDIIFDPFGGSGTTAIASRNLKRNFILFELDKQYCANAIERYNKV